MRIRYGWLVAGLVVAAMAAVVWWLPARWVMPLVQPRLRGVQLDLVSGRLWDGHAEQVLSAEGRTLGTLHWTLSHRLLLGEVTLGLHLKGPWLQFSGTLRQLGGSRQEWRDVALRIELDRRESPLQLPEGVPHGTLDVTVPYMVVQGNWPIQLEGWAKWRDAALSSGGHRLALGDLGLLMQGEGGMLKTQLHDGGDGPLALDGTAEASPLGWHLDATARARHDDPVLERWLAGLGALQSDGSVSIQRSGGLAAVMSEQGKGHE